jgi:hypothetical protein
VLKDDITKLTAELKALSETVREYKQSQSEYKREMGAIREELEALRGTVRGLNMCVVDLKETVDRLSSELREEVEYKSHAPVLEDQVWKIQDLKVLKRQLEQQELNTILKTTKLLMIRRGALGCHVTHIPKECRLQGWMCSKCGDLGHITAYCELHTEAQETPLVQLSVISTEDTRHEIALTTEQQVPLEQMTQNHQGSHGEAVSTSLDMSTTREHYS